MSWTRRRIMLACWAPLAILLLAFAVKVFVMTSNAEAGRSAYGTGQYDAAKRRFDTTQVVNIFEPWVAPYNSGTTLYQMNRYAEARGQLEVSLTKVPKAYDCMVRLNLVAAIEAQGDEAAARQNAADAKQRYDEALVVLHQGDCGTRPSGSPSASGSSKPPSSKSPTPSKASSGQSSSGQPSSGQSSKGQSGQPSAGGSQSQSASASAQPTSEEERKEQEQQRAQEAEERIEQKSEEARSQASQQARESSRAATVPPSTKAPDTPEQSAAKQSARASKDASGQADQREGQDYERRPSAGSDVDRPW